MIITKRRVVSLITSVIMIILQLNIAMPVWSANEAYKNFDSYTQTTGFDGLTVGTDIFAANLDSVNAPNTKIEIVQEDGNNVLKVTSGAGENKYPWAAMFQSGSQNAETLKIAFDVKVTSTSVRFRLTTTHNANKEIFLMRDGYVKLLGTTVEDLSYSKDTWYNVEIGVCASNSSATLKMKQKDADTWVERNVLNENYISATAPYAVSEIRLVFYHTLNNTHSFYIDNYSHTAVNSTDDSGSGDSGSGDSGSGDSGSGDSGSGDSGSGDSGSGDSGSGDSGSGDSTQDSQNSPYTPDTEVAAPTSTMYTTWNAFSETDYFEAGSVDQHMSLANATGGSSAEFAADPTNSENQVLQLHYGGTGGGAVFAMPWNNGSNAQAGPVRLAFDFYSAQDSCVGIRFLWGTTNIEVLRLESGTVYRKNGTPLKCNGENITFSNQKWYNVELGVNWERNYMELRIRKIGETEWTSVLVGDIADFEELTEASLLTQIRIGYHKTFNTEKDFFIDNYSHVVAPNVKPPYGEVSLAGNYENAADLDETVYIDYTATLDGTAGILAEIKAGNSVVETPYSLSAEGKRLSVKFSDLKPATVYDIKISGVTAAGGVKADDATLKFTTAPVYMQATKPQFSGNFVTTNVKSYYAGQKPVKLYLSLYKNGILTDVQVLTKNVSGRAGTDLSFDLSGILTDYDTARAYIWKSFAEPGPYSEAGGNFAGTITSASGLAAVESVVVNETEKTLTITGTIPESADDCITIEVLKENVVWSLADKTTGQLCLEEYDDSNAGDSILNYLSYFEQIDGASGKKYTLVVNNYLSEEEPEIRVRLGENKFYYHSPALMQAVNSASTAEALKDAVLGLEFVASTVQPYYDLLSEAEKPHFWSEYLLYRNSKEGGVFASQVEVLENFDDFVFLTQIKQASDTVALDTVIKACEQYGIYDSNAYDLYMGRYPFADGELNETQKSALLADVFAKRNEFNSLTGFVNDFLDKTVLYACYESGSKYLLKSVLTQSDRLDKSLMSKFMALGTDAKLDVCVTINRNGTLYSSKTDLCNAVETEAKNFSGGGGSAGGGSGGGGSGGGGSTGGSKDEGGSFVGSAGEGGPVSISPTQNNKFDDLTGVEWAEDAIDYLREKGIVAGKDENKFDPHSFVTREEFIKMLVLATGCYDAYATVAFSDVSDSAWYYRYVASAFKTDLIQGLGNGKFGVGESITRQDMALIVARADSGEIIPDNITSGFDDDVHVSDYAKSAVYYAKVNNLMNGVGNNMFAPKDFVTRAQAAKAIYEFIKRG